MSNPLVVEAIEDLFHPVLVYNNRKGSDAELLERFDEPAWNNPVVRYLSADEQDVIERKDGIWSTNGTVQRMVAALTAANRKVPQYLSALVTSEPPTSIETATFAMHCFWEGEAKLGAIKGVSSTQSGWVDSLEVVSVRFDPSLVDYAQLVDTAQSFDCASKIFTYSAKQLKLAEKQVGKDAIALNDDSLVKAAKASDQKYYLLQTRLRHLNLTETQATKINAALKSGKPVDAWLSPRQISLLQRIKTVTERDKNSLKSFQYPGKVSELAEYTTRLVDRLGVLESGVPQAK